MAISDDQKQKVYDFYADDYERHVEVTKAMARRTLVLDIEEFPFVKIESPIPRLGLPSRCTLSFKDRVIARADIIIREELDLLNTRKENGLEDFEDFDDLNGDDHVG